MHWPGAWQKFGGKRPPAMPLSCPLCVVRDPRCSAACCLGYVGFQPAQPRRTARRLQRLGKLPLRPRVNLQGLRFAPPRSHGILPRVPRLRPWPCTGMAWSGAALPTHGKDAPDMCCQLAADQARDSTRVPSSVKSHVLWTCGPWTTVQVACAPMRLKKHAAIGFLKCSEVM
ncbi:hypothetical protein GQ55_9G539000 [Panicum hallii var. hallii]|uniref:Uncharacterized protein n=1 Tax=Panicum hallii var. hallii TaxID=1504633 RepID=A0A2T7CEV5_9POAL|nr:hypothetical protein GQ55_9G539000 [Panicum hallii var. hallii]